MAEEKLRIGIWEENGVVFRRDSQKEPFSQQYVPRNPEGVSAIVSLAKQLHNGATMGSWTAQTEAQQDRVLEELKRLSV